MGPARRVYPDPQDWCNPPYRGAGLRPTLDTGKALVDAYPWIRIPGESDGECTRGLGPTGTVDPEWGRVDRAAGQWFPEMALQLARDAVVRSVAGDLATLNAEPGSPEAGLRSRFGSREPRLRHRA